MSNARLINTYFIIEVIDRGWEYHLTIPSDLKDIFDVDMMSTGIGEQHDVTELLEIVQNLFFNGELDLN